MEVIPSGSSKRLILPLHVTLGSIPLDSVTMETQTHSRLQPNKREQEDRETVWDIERQSKTGQLNNCSLIFGVRLTIHYGILCII